MACWHWPQRRGGAARARARRIAAATTICRVKAKICGDENSAGLYVSIMAFSSGLLLMLLLPRVRLAFLRLRSGRAAVSPEFSDAHLVARSYSGPAGITPRYQMGIGKFRVE